MGRFIAVVSFAFLSCGPAFAVDLAPPVPSVNPALLAHQTRFSEPEIITVKGRFHVAHGFDMCNIIFVEGPDGLIVMDTGFRVEKAAAAIAAVREITDKPIKAVFYSHGHGDHVGGSDAFRQAAPNAKFYAHEGWQRNVNHISSAVRPTFTLRAFAQLGLILPEGPTGTVGSGGGPVLRAGGTMSYVAPTHVTQDGEWLEIAGLKFQALHTPGDLDDGLSLWFPDDKTVLTGDTITDSHVHVILSTPRHEPGRDAQAFVDSLTRIGSLGADVLIGGHGDVVEGAQKVHELVRADRRTAQFMIDEVMRHIRQNRSGEFVQSNFAFPDGFLEEEDRGDYYHKLSWITRGVYGQFMGWFGGDGTFLAPVAPHERASRIVEGFGGAKGTVDALRGAYLEGDYRWAAELATYILSVDPKIVEARRLKAWSLTAIAYNSESANERNYLLTQALMLEGKIPVEALRQASAKAGLPAFYEAAESVGLLHTLGARLDVDTSKDLQVGFAVEVQDRDQTLYVEIDKGVLLVSPFAAVETDFSISIAHMDLARVCEGFASWTALQESGVIKVSGNAQDFQTVAQLF